MKITVFKGLDKAVFALTLVFGVAIGSMQAQTAPTAVNDTIRMCEGTTVLIDVLSNDSDPDAGEIL